METKTENAFKTKVQAVNDWGNTYSGAIAVAGLAATLLFLILRRR